jgi:hypothetical protein
MIRILTEPSPKMARPTDENTHGNRCVSLLLEGEVKPQRMTKKKFIKTWVKNPKKLFEYLLHMWNLEQSDKTEDIQVMQQEKNAIIINKNTALVTKNELEAALAAKNMVITNLIKKRD